MKIQVTHYYESEEEFRAAMGGTNRTADAEITASQVVQAAAPAPEAEPEAVVTAERDADEMPWNPEYHSDPRSFTADGLWRAKRGAAEAAKEARAKFKAAGGVVTMPAVETPAMPTMPVAAPILPPPVPLERLITKLTGMMQRGKLTVDQIGGLYTRVGATGGKDFETNETLRAALFPLLCEIEPEVA